MVLAYVNEVAIYVPTDDPAPSVPTWGYAYSAGWRDPDRFVAASETNLIAYGWPVPLRTAAHRAAGAAGLTTQEIVLDTCRRMVRGQPV